MNTNVEWDNGLVQIVYNQPISETTEAMVVDFEASAQPYALLL